MFLSRCSTLALCVAAWVACRTDAPRHHEFAVGMTRTEITSRYGEPERTQVLTKSDESIWGPIESFWAEVPMGAKVELWSFQSTNVGQPGETELYFIDDADTVDGIGFHIEGAVYEGS